MAPGLGSVSGIVLAHCTGTRPHCVWWGNGAPDCFEMALGGSERISDNVGHILVGTHHGCCSRAVTRGLDRRVLDGVNARSLAGFGWESFAWVRCTGFTDGSWPMGSIPGARTGDGGLDGETFLGGLLIFFLFLYTRSLRLRVKNGVTWRYKTTWSYKNLRSRLIDFPPSRHPRLPPVPPSKINPPVRPVSPSVSFNTVALPSSPFSTTSSPGSGTSTHHTHLVVTSSP